MNDEGTNQVYGIANTTASISYFLFIFFLLPGPFIVKISKSQFLVQRKYVDAFNYL